jgi:hypothetical protein
LGSKGFRAQNETAILSTSAFPSWQIFSSKEKPEATFLPAPALKMAVAVERQILMLFAIVCNTDKTKTSRGEWLNEESVNVTLPIKICKDTRIGEAREDVEYFISHSIQSWRVILDI